jgi:hypothetical protein
MNTTTMKKHVAIPTIEVGNPVAAVKKLFRRKSGLEKALDDVRKGRVYRADSVEDLMRKTTRKWQPTS